MTQPFPAATILGYPRIGPGRELKKAVESFWAGTSDLGALQREGAQIRRKRLERMGHLGLTGAGLPSDFSFYDHMLDAAVTFGALPGRFGYVRQAGGAPDLAGYFTLARGEGGNLPLEMTKWFDSNYHYLVPEIGPQTPLQFCEGAIVRQLVEAASWGLSPRPVIVGPVTFLALAKAADDAPAGFRPLDRLDDLLAGYEELLGALAGAGATWVQLDEPALVADLSGYERSELAGAAGRAYDRLAQVPSRPGLFAAMPYGSAGAAAGVLARAGVEAIGLDLVKGEVPQALADGDLANVTVVAGVVDGHNIWRTDLAAALDVLEQVGAKAGAVSVATSASLFHVPLDVSRETALPGELADWLAFADQKIGEVLLLARGLEDRSAIGGELAANQAMLASRASADGVRVTGVRERLAAIQPSDIHRDPYPVRLAAQADLGLPALPATTIGSFPQTPQIRQARAAFRAGRLPEASYTEAMRAEIARVVALQEEIGLDVLVHGEAERNDMVQYFGEQLTGFATTQHGWVQSYGSRCTRPSILWGDVERPKPMTVGWTSYAQSLSPKPMKGMLTGPVTILAWSFVRNDQPLGLTANQVALALRDEVADLEAAGIRIIQVDEPALRELLPLDESDRTAYLDWSVGAFRLATGGAGPATQIHTHLCYSEFGEIMDAIDGLDADVTSIEAARSKMEIVADIAASGYERQIGPGVYDIHSPRVPSEAEMTELLRTAAHAINPAQLWVNPDCGLKTRTYAEVTPALKAMVAAAAEVRAGL